MYSLGFELMTHGLRGLRSNHFAMEDKGVASLYFQFIDHRYL